MIDVDGSCLYKKHQQQGWVWSVDDDTIPDIPVEVNSSGEQHLKLKPTHIYYSQIQGQMAITERSWCDFVIYTEKGISVERIPFDAEFWNNKLLPKLIDFFDNCLAPEIVSPVNALGIPVRNLCDM